MGNRFDGNSTPDPLRWQPVHKGGGVYCSPGCGFGCTLHAWQQATEEGSILAAHMGAGWEVRVWENSGWHYAVHKGVAHIHPSIRARMGAGPITGGWDRPEGYTCYFNARPQVLHRAETPEEALNLCLVEVLENRKALDRALLPFREDGL